MTKRQREREREREMSAQNNKSPPLSKICWIDTTPMSENSNNGSNSRKGPTTLKEWIKKQCTEGLGDKYKGMLVDERTKAPELRS